MTGCWLCGTINDCSCPTPEELERRQKLMEQRERQAAHEASIKRQRTKLKIAPWRREEQ